MSAKFDNGDLVYVVNGRHKGLRGTVVHNEGPLLWVKFNKTEVVDSVHEDHMVRA
ncbi:KOW motif-containing protein [Anaerobacillus arseniciselenatis]|uniref:KOW motif-containing protein n=1 Tax=Anaerobacillus arseniciselenatis TaxID=85682 RepID=UPI000A062F61|nr:KOW motif-containing protein [Anaerobacillus arseniciselenatis]